MAMAKTIANTCIRSQCYSALEGAIRIYSAQATTPGYALNDVRHSHDIGIAGSIFSDGSIAYATEVSPSPGAIEFRLPSDEQLYEKSLPIQYNANLSRPIPVGDGKHFTWETTNVEGTIIINFGTREQARKLEICSWLFFSLAVALTLCIVIWLAKRLYKHEMAFRRSCKERGLSWCKDTRHWRVELCIDGANVYVGEAKTVKAASKLRDDYLAQQGTRRVS